MAFKFLCFSVALLTAPMAFSQEMSEIQATEGTLGVQASGTSTQGKQSPLYEASCKIKAKEAAASLFRSCMTEGKNAQLELIRKDYQEKLSQMRADYEKELSRLSKLKKTNDSEKTEVKKQEEAVLKASKNASNSKLLKSKSPPLTKKGLPIKTVKTVVNESLHNGMDSAKETANFAPVQQNQEMSLTLKPSKAVLFDEVQEVPEPISVENFEAKSNDSASIQLD